MWGKIMGIEKIVVGCVDIEGYHYWEDAIDKVAFLRNPHRHIFKFKAGVRVSDNDREVEIFMLRDYIVNAIARCYDLDLKLLAGDYYQFNNASCETLCEDVHEYLTDQLKLNVAFVECFEEDTGGARINYSDSKA